MPDRLKAQSLAQGRFRECCMATVGWHKVGLDRLQKYVLLPSRLLKHRLRQRGLTCSFRAAEALTD